MNAYDADFWERHYRLLDHSWSTRPNAAVEVLVPKLFDRPGRALDLGAGHGGDATWLAFRGWSVTAVDVSQTALDRVDARAAVLGLTDRLSTRRCDVTALRLPDGPFDLVTASFLHVADREKVLRRTAESVPRGGALLVVDHGSCAPWSWNSASYQSFPTPAETADALALGAAWRAEVLESSTRVTTGPSGRSAEVTDTIVAMRRIA
ncbi:Methyltransferase domain-containing protein [Sinosporangium album]|uniref:Methyltransferase domain-containing protein n=1 Tax=Sinosporangium album TaxID=504805 RepID=A0A1G8CLH4_9ACTN|nr:class I SAM-dependent methyltransferase [Sinosporangium album]SDH46265.1 Methyltransferase domain-containing protein [Sinosporangium album]